jgi:Spy/CpxP family protein refolding chaperone
MKSKRALVIALVTSIALNLVAIGIFLGRAAGPRPEMHRVDPVFGMRRLFGDLPTERAQELAPLYREYFAAMRPRVREIRVTQETLRSAMLTEPLDEAGLRAALKSFEAKLTSSQQAGQEAFIALAAALTFAERQQLVESMGRRPERWRPGDHKRSAPDAESTTGARPPYHHVPPEPPPR